jgi:hypothetical protein
MSVDVYTGVTELLWIPGAVINMRQVIFRKSNVAVACRMNQIFVTQSVVVSVLCGNLVEMKNFRPQPQNLHF